MEAMNRLEGFRQEIDDVDSQIVEALAKRFEIAKRVADFKKQQGIPMMQPDRVEAVKQRRRELGTQHGLDGEFMVALYSLIIQETCRVEDEIIEAQG
ncbi:chorismate mutase [Anabaena cylindrica FACHB-243]|uniref:Chorismate mutase, type II n=2 Tax=Nostocaceae TaxID=1162 RepID=K9ZK08_ANACC|nr:Chorismate mutase, type II [Anabaena cylindrica PCC 7122]MBD2419210.1 chorismate mutase [Anabaena cylindrica FACHB-243]MBY5283541.1 chorismate mutase [Anabaena sp. CCAP 1446/1C]MBY5308913.1 chorismate mutase [Anabaena sp. CCAP 1446/1C]BAY03871.1 chorismate mutase related enzymes [Anabaena cylindrica PCC 7122]